MGFPFKVLGC